MRLLVLRALGLGDVLTGLPALRGVRRAWPQARVVLATGAAAGDLLRRAGVVDDVLPAGEDLAPLPWTGDGHVAVNLHGRGPQSHRALLGTRPSRLVAYPHPDVPGVEGPAWDEAEHEVRRWARLVPSYELDPDDLLLPPSERDPVVAGAVLVHPGAAHAARRWPAGRFAAVARVLHGRGHRVVVTGSPDERALASQVAEGLPPGSVLAGDLDLPGMVALLQSAALVVVGDTGVGHLATACGTPAVHLFGPEPPGRWAPLLHPERHAVLWHGVEGVDVGGGGRADRPDPLVLRITVDEVLAAADRLLHPPHPRSRSCSSPAATMRSPGRQPPGAGVPGPAHEHAHPDEEHPMADTAHGVDPSALDEADLVRELSHLHETRHETFLHGSPDALSAHTDRTAALEQEYLRRHPERDVDVQRTRDGARSRG